MEISRLFGLPAHPLIVHAAVVLLPLAALATIVCGVVPRARRHYAPVALALALAATVAVGLAQGSGEELEHSVDRTQLVRDHTGDAEQVLPWAVLVTVAAAALTAAPYATRWKPSLSGRAVNGALAAIALVVSIGATATVISVGHSGAKAAWHDVGDTSQPAR